MQNNIPTHLLNIAQAMSQALQQRPVRLDLTAHYSRPASVFMPMCWYKGQAHMLFTKRTDKLYHHGGQISFPGGSQDPDDPDPAYAALRETFEEIGVGFQSLHLILRLDQLATYTGFLITPFLGILHPAENFKINHDEVERLIMVPLVKLLNLDNWQEEEIIWQGTPTYWTALKHDNDIIWGATARILLNFIASLQEVGLDWKIAVDRPAQTV